MRISPEHIQEKAIAGKTKDGAPILYVLTKGGLHAFFVKAGEGIESIGAAPHRAVASWIAEKKSPGIEWAQEFIQKSELAKSEKAMFERVRGLMFRQEVPAAPAELTKSMDLYFVYDPRRSLVEVMSEGDVRARLEKGEHRWSFVRPVNLSEPVDFTKYHPKFRESCRE